MKVEGGCHCGHIKYEAVVNPEAVGICHCSDCQALTGSAYRVTVPAAAETFVLHGQPKLYVKTAESGAKRAHAFCPDCGTPIYAAAIENPQSYSLRLGNIKQRTQLARPKRQIWCDSALPWSMDLSAIPQIPRQP